MIIDQCRKLALRAPARVVFPDALDVRVLKAAHYLQQQGLAHPILVASPFALRQFALGERLPLTGCRSSIRTATWRCARRLPPPGRRAPAIKRPLTRSTSWPTR
jgi:hypothetical protein